MSSISDDCLVKQENTLEVNLLPDTEALSRGDVHKNVKLSSRKLIFSAVAQWDRTQYVNVGGSGIWPYLWTPKPIQIQIKVEVHLAIPAKNSA